MAVPLAIAAANVAWLTFGRVEGLAGRTVFDVLVPRSLWVSSTFESGAGARGGSVGSLNTVDVLVPCAVVESMHCLLIIGSTGEGSVSRGGTSAVPLAVAAASVSCFRRDTGIVGGAVVVQVPRDI